MSAVDAERYGLVTAVVEPGELLDQARATAASILTKGPVAVRLAKLVIRAGMDTDLRTGQLIERLAQTVLYQTDDKVEGTNAFLEKRPAQFRGR